VWLWIPDQVQDDKRGGRDDEREFGVMGVKRAVINID